MKTVTKIILCSCVFCYFAGLWMIASRFGLLKLITRYGLAESFDRIPKDFPQVRYLYALLVVYTVLFAILGYVIVKYSGRVTKEQEQLQQEVAVVVSYAERMNILLSQYERSNINNIKVKQRLQTLSRQIASLPPAVACNANMKLEVSNIVGELQKLLSDQCSIESFSAAIDNACDAIDSLKRRSIIVKY